MEILKCYLDPFANKQMLKDGFTKEEYWVDTQDVCEEIYRLCNKKGYNKVSLEGSYLEGLTLMHKFANMYPGNDITFYTL